ncbi:uncharacterized protein PFL1_03897 [Pseudozyma flocculosa PF-1]|uniref:Uncharacterized protein n=2 Tax=Pseudozyma flocculosa TaxID=84751 RepID=A0A5C3EW86_9BASI|nr:uncharacterized protein PFL1_03897 [Pseudozyma flocculosa PF-1]EPQ28594.1 hypothetical protein PFL1_03897 [Pseudozyma flocculosa PF-1]SPO36534.1 uncharacterized protein PSFLO_02005 [Pseudozyma flocculosa]
MEPALGAPFGGDAAPAAKDDPNLRKRVETLFHDFANGSEVVKVRDLPNMFETFQRIQGQPFLQPQDHANFLVFAGENPDIPVHAEDLVSLVLKHEAARSPLHSPAMEQRPDTDNDTSSDEDAAPGTVFKGRATGSPSFSRPPPPRLRGRHSSAGERSSNRSPRVSDAAYVGSPLARTKESLTPPPSVDIDAVQRDLLESQRRIAQLEEELAEQAQNLDLLRRQLRDEEGRMSGLERQLEDRASTIDKLNEQLADREQKLEKVHGLEDNYETRMYELQEHSDELASQLKEAAKENKELRIKSQSRQTYIERLESEMSELQKKRQEDEAAYRKLRNDHDGLRKDHNRLQKEREDQCDTTERIRQQLIKETERVERKQEEVDRLAFQVQEKEADMQRADRRIAELEGQLEPLEEALAGSRSTNSDLQNMIEMLREGDTDTESLVGKHRRLGSEMHEVTGRTPSEVSDARSEASSIPSAPASASEHDSGLDSDDDDSHSAAVTEAEGDAGSMIDMSTGSPPQSDRPSTPTLAAKPEEARTVDMDDERGAAPGPLRDSQTDESKALLSGAGLEEEAAAPASTTTPPPAAASSEAGLDEDSQTTPKMLAASSSDDVAPITLDAPPSKPAQRRPGTLLPFAIKPTALIDRTRALLRDRKAAWTRIPALDRSVLRRTELYFAISAVVVGILLGGLLAPQLHWCRPGFASPSSSSAAPAAAGATAGLSREEVYAFHTANTMSMPYAFAPDFGESGLFSPTPPPRAWYARVFGLGGARGEPDFFIPT